MGMTTYPLPVPDDLLKAVKRAAKKTGLSQAATMRQAIKLGLPKVQQGLSAEEDFAEAGAETWEKLGPPPGIVWDKLPRK